MGSTGFTCVPTTRSTRIHPNTSAEPRQQPPPAAWPALNHHLPPLRVVVTGSSAGSMGVQLWAASALEQLSMLNFERTAVIPDSFVGVSRGEGGKGGR